MRTKGASIRAFCTTAELLVWTDALCGKWNLTCLYFESLKSDGVELRAGEIAARRMFHSAFLFPIGTQLESKSYEAQAPRYLGWITVRGGAAVIHEGESVLTVAEIIAEDRDDEDVHPTRFVRWLKRHLDSAGSIHWGVTGENTVAGGISRYANIGYSVGALALLQEGFLWKNHPSYRAVFRP